MVIGPHEIKITFINRKKLRNKEAGWYRYSEDLNVILCQIE
jgi:hypothetical protein